jgi:hypothetical protein
MNKQNNSIVLLNIEKLFIRQFYKKSILNYNKIYLDDWYEEEERITIAYDVIAVPVGPVDSGSIFVDLFE